MASFHLSLTCLLLVSGVICDEKKELFTTGLLKELATAAPGKNIVFSPTSLQTAMSIVGFGTKGDTEKEVWTTLGLNPENAKTLMTEKQLKLSETPAPGAEWQMANRIMASPNFPVKQEYKDEVSQSFPGTAIDNFNFEEPEKTANEVNTWVSEKTNRVINKLLDSSAVNPKTMLIVLNAVYFKGEWKHGFDKKKTKKECFYSEPGKCTMTDMMHIKEDFKYGYHNDMKAQIIEFPYKNENFSMIVVLPDEKHHNLTSFLSNKLDVDEITTFIDSKEYPVEVHVTMPKFEIEFERQLKDSFVKLGMKKIFSDSSDLSGMVSGLGARVDSVVHKAKITCDEEGTVAAAATGIEVVAFSLPRIYTMKLDRPYIFIIRNNQTGALFVGINQSFEN